MFSLKLLVVFAVKDLKILGHLIFGSQRI